MKEVITSTFFAGLMYVLRLQFLGGWDSNLQIIFTAMVIDYITGCIVAVVFKKSQKTDTGAYASNIGLKGLMRKAGIIFAIWIGFLLQRMTGIVYIRDMLIYGFTANEVMSILENLSLMGVKTPTIITNALDVLKKKGEQENDKGNTGQAQD